MLRREQVTLLPAHHFTAGNYFFFFFAAFFVAKSLTPLRRFTLN